jgi:hypothetical protein
MVKDAVYSFIKNFEMYFDTASLYAKKLVFQKCIKTIIIDRKTEMVRFYFQPVPAVITQIDRIIKKSPAQNGLGSDSSGGTHFSLLSTLHYVIEMPLNKNSSN